MQNQTYPVVIGNRTVQLPILPLPNGINIAFFNLHGNADLTEYCAKLLTPLCNNADVLITAESKGLQLTHCVARNLGHTYYAVARKAVKLYMQDGISATVKSITTGQEQTLYISSHDTQLIKGKKVAIIDDVISTGGSVRGLERLVMQAGATLVAKCFVLAEGDAAERTDIKYIAKIPLL